MQADKYVHKKAENLHILVNSKSRSFARVLTFLYISDVEWYVLRW